MELSEKAKELYAVLSRRKFDAGVLLDQLNKGHYSKDDITTTAIEYVEECAYEDMSDLIDVGEDMNIEWSICGDHRLDELYLAKDERIMNIRACNMCEVLDILLDYGLDPNAVYREDHSEQYYEEYNIMHSVQYIDLCYITADALSLLLDRGGISQITVNGVDLMEVINRDLDYLMLRSDYESSRFDALFHCWLVTLGHGAKSSEGASEIVIREGFDVSEFKNHRNYYFGAVFGESEKPWKLIVFDKETNRNVATY